MRNEVISLLQFQHIACRQIVQSRHTLLEICVLLCSGAVAGVIFSWQSLQLSCCLLQNLFVVATGGKLHEMKATDANVWLKPFHQVQDALMRATAQEHLAPLFVNSEILFMTKIIGHKFITLQHVEAKAVSKVLRLFSLQLHSSNSSSIFR